MLYFAESTYKRYLLKQYTKNTAECRKECDKRREREKLLRLCRHSDSLRGTVAACKNQVLKHKCVHRPFVVVFPRRRPFPGFCPCRYVTLSCCQKQCTACISQAPRVSLRIRRRSRSFCLFAARCRRRCFCLRRF